MTSVYSTNFAMNPSNHQPISSLNVSRFEDLVYNLYLYARLPPLKPKPTPEEVLNKKLKNLYRNYKFKTSLRNYYRTSIFRDELIYLPNVGYKYFEGLESWNTSQNFS